MRGRAWCARCRWPDPTGRVAARAGCGGQDTGDVLLGQFSSCAWPGMAWVLLPRYDAPPESAKLAGKVNEYQKLYFHRLGKPQSDDTLVYEAIIPSGAFAGETTEDGRYLVITVSEGTDTRNRVFYRDLSKPRVTGGRYCCATLTRATTSSGMTDRCSIFSISMRRGVEFWRSMSRNPSAPLA